MENNIYHPTTVVLVSGGLDSFVAYHYLREEGLNPSTLYIDYKGRYCWKEKKAVEKLFPGTIMDNSLNLSKFEVGEKAFIKNRNAMFALIASNYADRIVMAGLKDDHVGDKTPRSFNLMANLLNEMESPEITGKHRVYSPFWSMEKLEVLKWYLDNFKDHSPLQDIISCYHPTLTNCGMCPACFRKFCAYSFYNVPTPPFKNAFLAFKYLEMYKDDHTCRGESIRWAVKEAMNR